MAMKHISIFSSHQHPLRKENDSQSFSQLPSFMSHKNNNYQDVAVVSPSFNSGHFENKENENGSILRRVQSVNLKKNIAYSNRQSGWPAHTEVTNRVMKENFGAGHLIKHHNENFSSSSTTLHHSRSKSQLVQPVLQNKLQEIIEKSRKSIENCVPEEVLPLVNVKNKRDLVPIDLSHKGLHTFPLEKDLFYASEGKPIKLLLGQNKIKSLTRVVFSRNIIILDLSFNGLEKIDLTSISHGSSRIRELILRGNKLSRLQCESNTVFQSLRKLDLSENDLPDQQIVSFIKRSTLMKLKLFDLSSNRLEYVDTLHLILSVVFPLREFKASNNSIQGGLVLERDSLLKVLCINGNKLTTFSLVTELNHLRKFDLSANLISIIDWNGMAFLPRISQLSIRGNHLTFTNQIQGLLSVSPKLKSLDIGENHFKERVFLQSNSVETLYLDGNEDMASLNHFEDLQFRRLKWLYLPRSLYIDEHKLKQAFPYLVQVNGQSIKQVQPISKMHKLHHQRSVSQGVLTGNRHGKLEQQPFYAHVQTSSQDHEFSISQQHHIQSHHHHQSLTIDNDQMNSSLVPEEIFNSQVVMLGCGGEGDKKSHMRKSSLGVGNEDQSSFFSKRMSYRSMNNIQPAVCDAINAFEEVIINSEKGGGSPDIGPSTSRERVEEIERLQKQIFEIAGNYQRKGSYAKQTSEQLLNLFKDALDQMKMRLSQNAMEIRPQQLMSPIILSVEQSYRNHHNQVPAQQPPPPTQFSTRKSNIDYEHLITLLSTPISLFISTIICQRNDCLPCNASTFFKELSIALGFNVSSFNLGKYIFQHQDETDIIDQILSAYNPIEDFKGGSAHKRRVSLSQLPALDSFVLKSTILREMLESEIQSIGQSSSRDQWDVVKELRENILQRASELEKSLTMTAGLRKQSSNALREEFAKLDIIEIKQRKYEPTLSNIPSSLQYLNTSEEDQPQKLKEVEAQEKQIFNKDEENSVHTQSSFQQLPSPSDDVLSQALQELILYARHPLRQITVEQADVSFTDDITPLIKTTQTNAYEEGKLVKYLLSAFNENQLRLVRATKCYNYQKIHELVPQGTTEGLTLMFGRVYSECEQRQFLNLTMSDKQLFLSSSLIELDNALNQTDKSRRQCLVIMLKEDDIMKSRTDPDCIDAVTQDIQYLPKYMSSRQRLRYFEKLGIYQLQTAGQQIDFLAVYHIEYELK